MNFELISPFLRVIQPLLQDPEISDIMVHGDRNVFIERHGCIAPVPSVIVTEKFLRVALINIARALGKEVSEEQPILDARLPDGSRVAAILAPCSIEGSTLTYESSNRIDSRPRNWFTPGRSRSRCWPTCARPSKTARIF
jgi:pilus assembly protein CpaF